MILPISSVFFDSKILYHVNMVFLYYSIKQKAIILILSLTRMLIYWKYTKNIPEPDLPKTNRILLLLVLLIAFDILGYCYFIIGFNYGYLILQKGFSFLFVAWLAAWQGDNGGLLFGRLFGTKKMCPWISPKKTYEGGFGAVIFSVLTLIICYLMKDLKYADIFLPNFTLLQYVFLGVFGGSAAVFGDLIESLMKRAADIKVFFKI